MGYAILGVVVVVFTVFLVFAAKNWHWSDVVAVALLFPLVLTFVVLSAFTLRTHANWRSLYQRQKAELENVQRKIELLRDGSAVSAAGELQTEENSISSLRAELGRKLYDRGRVWPNCFPREFDGNSITVITAQWGNERCTGATPAVARDEGLPATEPAPAEGEEAEGGEAAQPRQQPRGRPHGIAEQTVLYAFVETPLAALGAPIREAIFAGSEADFSGRERVCSVPSMYLGEFTVTSETPDGITMSPTIPLSEEQTAVLAAPQSTWMLVEMMPVDSHEILAELEEDQLRVLFPESLVNEYIRDGKDADRNRDLPERIMVRVTFKKPYKIDVDAPDEQMSLPSEDFNALGQAISPWLRQGGDGEDAGRVQFEVGDKAVLDVVSAEQLIAQEICDEDARIYKRPLWDFEYQFHDLYRRQAIVEDTISTTQQDIRRLEESIARTRQSIAYRNEERERLNEDKGHIEYERDQITNYRNALDNRYQETLRELSELYRNNRRRARRLALESRRHEETIEQRTRVSTLPGR